MRRGLLALLLLSIFPGVTSAQGISSYVARYYAAGAAAPTQTESFVATAVTCNLPPTPSGLTVNPTKLEWDDPSNAGRVCQRVSAGSGNLQSLPFGSFEATLAAINTGGSSPESARSPFSRAVVAPAAPTGLKAIP